MNYDNKHTDKKLQDLEHQSLPDLSKMDEHWQQMGSLLQPGTASLPGGKNILLRKFLFTFFGIAALVTICFFIFRNNNHAETDRTKEIPVNNSIAAIDSPFQLKARTSDGRDTMLTVTPVIENTTQKNSKLLLEKFYEQLQKKPQAFLINNQRDTVINGKEGTRLYIPVNSFDTKESFTLLLTEFYSVNDMIAEKLTTTCDGRQLVTGGMIYLDARNNNDDPLDLKNGASLRIDIPQPHGKPRMELFYGKEYYRNDVTTVIDSINWNRTSQVFTDAKANPVQSFLNNDIPISISKRDSTRLMERGDLPITLDYTTKDTVPGKPGLTIKGDSIVLQKFGVNINRLGWINCDRFLNDARPKTELIVDLGDNPNNYNTMLVFDKFASIMPPSSKQGNTVRFLNLPEGEPARIVAVGIRNDKTVTAMRKLVISKTPVGDLNFEEIGAFAFRKKLDQKAVSPK